MSEDYQMGFEDGKALNEPPEKNPVLIGPVPQHLSNKEKREWWFDRVGYVPDNYKSPDTKIAPGFSGDKGRLSAMLTQIDEDIAETTVQSVTTQQQPQQVQEPPVIRRIRQDGEWAMKIMLDMAAIHDERAADYRAKALQIGHDTDKQIQSALSHEEKMQALEILFPKTS